MIKLMDNLPAVIDAQWLQKWGADPNAVAAFAEQWPYGCAVTRESLTVARELRVNLPWLAASVLPPVIYAGFWAERDLRWADYIAKCDEIDAEHQAKLDAAADEFDTGRDALIIDLVLEFAREKQHGQNSGQTAAND